MLGGPTSLRRASLFSTVDAIALSKMLSASGYLSKSISSALVRSSLVSTITPFSSADAMSTLTCAADIAVTITGRTRRCLMFDEASVSRSLAARAASLESLLSARNEPNVHSTTMKSPLGDTATASKASRVLALVPNTAVEKPSAHSSQLTAASKSSAALLLGGRSGWWSASTILAARRQLSWPVGAGKFWYQLLSLMMLSVVSSVGLRASQASLA